MPKSWITTLVGCIWSTAIVTMWMSSGGGVEGCGEPLKRICYYTSWGGVLPNPPELCTHVIYAFASMENGMLSGVWSNPLKEIKQKSPEIKLMVAVGGWGFGVQRMTEMLKDESSRKKFVDDSVNFLKKFEFDGLDLDFECNQHLASFLLSQIV